MENRHSVGMVFVDSVKASTLLISGTDRSLKILYSGDFPGGAVVKNPPANAGDTGSSPGPGGSHMPQSS